MEIVIGVIILVVLYKVFIKILPSIWFVILFLGALFVLLTWVGFLEATGLSIVIGIIGAVIGAWAFAKAKS